MKHSTFSKPITFQASIISFLDGKAVGAWKAPFVAFPETDAAVAFSNQLEFWDLDAEFKGTAVAVTLVCLELWFWSGG